MNNPIMRISDYIELLELDPSTKVRFDRLHTLTKFELAQPILIPKNIEQRIEYLLSDNLILKESNRHLISPNGHARILKERKEFTEKLRGFRGLSASEKLSHAKNNNIDPFHLIIEKKIYSGKFEAKQFGFFRRNPDDPFLAEDTDDTIILSRLFDKEHFTDEDLRHISKTYSYKQMYQSIINFTDMVDVSEDLIDKYDDTYGKLFPQTQAEQDKSKIDRFELTNGNGKDKSKEKFFNLCSLLNDYNVRFNKKLKIVNETLYNKLVEALEDSHPQAKTMEINNYKSTLKSIFPQKVMYNTNIKKDSLNQSIDLLIQTMQDSDYLCNDNAEKIFNTMQDQNIDESFTYFMEILKSYERSADKMIRAIKTSSLGELSYENVPNWFKVMIQESLKNHTEQYDKIIKTDLGFKYAQREIIEEPKVEEKQKSFDFTPVLNRFYTIWEKTKSLARYEVIPKNKVKPKLKRIKQYSNKIDPEIYHRYLDSCIDKLESEANKKD